MISYEELNEDIHRITELTNILRYLFKDRSMCDTHTCCSLFNKYFEQVSAHMDLVDKDFSTMLLKDHDNKVNAVAKNFMSGSVEIKRIIKDFKKQWCSIKPGDNLKIKDHTSFIDNTDELFDIVLQRIQDETEHLYPMVRSLRKAAS